VLDRDRVGVCVQVWNRLIFRHPATEDLVGDRELTCFVVELDDDVFAKVLERDLGSEPRTEVPYFVSPLLKLGVVSNAALEGDRFSVRPGDLRVLEGSPPSRCLTTSVVRLSELTLLTPATYLPSHLTRNLKFLYGSKRVALTLN
jgi:hypothetical protein